MPLNHDLVHQTFDRHTPKDHVLVLADHADEQGYPPLAEAFRNEQKSVNPYPWYDENYGIDPELRSGSHQRYLAGEDPHDTVDPYTHVQNIRRKGHQLAPGIYAVKGLDGFGRSGAQDQGFHVYDLRGIDTEYDPDKKEYERGHEVPDPEAFGSRTDYNAALEEYLAGKGAPRFFRYKGSHAVKLAQKLPVDEQLAGYNDLSKSVRPKGAGRSPAALVLADYLDEKGHPLLATIIRRHHAMKKTPSSFYPLRYLKSSDPYTLGAAKIPVNRLAIGRVAGVQPSQLHAMFRVGTRKFYAPLHPEEARELWKTYVPEDHDYTPEILDRAMTYQEHNNPQYPKLDLARTDVISQGLSEQQKARKRLALQIAREAALRLEALYDARTQNNAGVLQVYGHDNEPEAVDYAAAWYGLLTREPKLTTFHVHDGGPDTYHSWETSLDPDKVLTAARDLGLDAVVTSKGKVSVLDHGNQLAAPISKLKEVSYARSTSAEPGTARRLHSRDEYRATIQRYSQGASPAGNTGATQAATTKLSRGKADVRPSSVDRPINAALVYAALKDPAGFHILADHVDEQGYPHLASVLRRRVTDIERPDWWHTDDPGSLIDDETDEGNPSGSAHTILNSPELAPGIHMVPNRTAFGYYVSPKDQARQTRQMGFHIFDMRGFKWPDSVSPYGRSGDWTHPEWQEEVERRLPPPQHYFEGSQKTPAGVEFPPTELETRKVTTGPKRL